MDDITKQRLTRFLKNAKSRIWDIYGEINLEDLIDKLNIEIPALLKNKWKDLNSLETSLIIKDKTPWARAEQHLLDNIGIEKLIKDLVVPTINGKYKKEQLDLLRDFWMAGELPNLALMRAKGMKPEAPFLEIDKSHKSYYSWSDFAIFWFEELEPWLVSNLKIK